MTSSRMTLTTTYLQLTCFVQAAVPRLYIDDNFLSISTVDSQNSQVIAIRLCEKLYTSIYAHKLSKRRHDQ
jgi:hypothetical protein